MADEKTHSKKKRQRRNNGKPYRITYEIVPPGTLKRNPGCLRDRPKDRWSEIIEICCEIVKELHTLK